MKQVFTFDEVADLMLYALVAKGELNANTSYSFGVRGTSDMKSIEFSIEKSDKPRPPQKRVDEFGDEIEDVNLEDE